MERERENVGYLYTVEVGFGKYQNFIMIDGDWKSLKMISIINLNLQCFYEMCHSISQFGWSNFGIFPYSSRRVYYELPHPMAVFPLRTSQELELEAWRSKNRSGCTAMHRSHMWNRKSWLKQNRLKISSFLDYFTLKSAAFFTQHTQSVRIHRIKLAWGVQCAWDQIICQLQSEYHVSS